MLYVIYVVCIYRTYVYILSTLQMLFITAKDKPTIKDLNIHVIEQYAIYWKQLGVELGVKNYHIANITENNASRKLRQVEECCSQMLQKWLDIDPSATWDKLDDAIKKITSPVSTDKEGNHVCKLLVLYFGKNHFMKFCY